MLHELARQVKGELAREVARELAMARDLADELAEREGELGQTAGRSNPGAGTDPADKDGKTVGNEARVARATAREAAAAGAT